MDSLVESNKEKSKTLAENIFLIASENGVNNTHENVINLHYSNTSDSVQIDTIYPKSYLEKQQTQICLSVKDFKGTSYTRGSMLHKFIRRVEISSYIKGLNPLFYDNKYLDSSLKISNIVLPRNTKIKEVLFKPKGNNMLFEAHRYIWHCGFYLDETSVITLEKIHPNSVVLVNLYY